MQNKYYNKEKKEVLECLSTSEKGLTTNEAVARLTKNGKNQFKEQKKKSFFGRFIDQFKDLLIIILLFSAIISVVVAVVDRDPSEYLNAGVILAVVLLNACIGVVQENKADKAMEKLKNIAKPYAKVMRDNKLIKIKIEDLVVGDIVILEAGDTIPADLRIIESRSLKIDEAILTGESHAIEKDSKVIDKDEVSLGDRKNMAYMATTVVYGRGKGVVVNTGMKTEIGNIANMLNRTKQEQTPLTKKVQKTSIYISIVVLAVALFILLSGVFAGDSFASSLIMAVAIAVCAVPEGLPACVTIIMSIGVNEMSKKRAIVKNLYSVETLGSTQIICTDKTGTLTLNKMVVKDAFTFDEFGINVFLSKKGKSVELNQESKNIEELIKCMLLCNDSVLKVEDNKLISIGDPTEIALSEFANEFGIKKEKIEQKNRRVSEIPFDSGRKLMTTIHSQKNQYISYTKGAVDNLLERCNRIMVNGKIEKLTLKKKEEILAKNDEFAGRAWRVLGFATNKAESLAKEKIDNLEKDMIFLGLVGMMDPPRKEVYGAIKTCKKAGIKTVMITGDHKVTAYAIAKELGIAKDEKQVITGAELDLLSDREFLETVEKKVVYARVNPEHKVRIVEALQRKGNVVAMTGDGVNDAPSIKKADIGIGMGITGTDVTKDAADVILTDDNFATIVGAVKEGRRIYDNILKVLQFLVGTSVAELFILTVITTFLREHFFTPILILWFNLISDSLVALALGAEQAEKGVMNKKPIKKGGSLFSGRVGINLAYTSICVTLLVLGVFSIGKWVLGFSSSQVTTMCFLTLVFAELLHSYNLKSDINSIFNKDLFKNKWLNIAFIVSLFLSVIVLIIPSQGWRSAFGVDTIGWKGWLISVLISILIVPLMEIEKLILRKIDRKKK